MDEHAFEKRYDGAGMSVGIWRDTNFVTATCRLQFICFLGVTDFETSHGNADLVMTAMSFDQMS